MPLTDAEIAELRRTLDSDDGGPSAAQEIADGAARAAVPRLLDEVGRARALLRRIEWSVPGDGGGVECPECRSEHRHMPGCELSALLGGAGGEQDPQKP